jgi:hypothetical protein
MEEDREEKEKKYRISKVTGSLMFSVALFYDALEFLLEWLAVGLVINPLIAIFAGLHFWLWFRLHGVDFMSSPKRMATKWITDIVEFIPTLDALVVASLGHTIGVLILLILVRIEDKTGIKVPLPEGKVKPTLVSARHNTLQGGNAMLKERAARLAASGPGGGVKARPTLASSRAASLRGSGSALQRRGGNDIVPRSGRNLLVASGSAGLNNEAEKINRMRNSRGPAWADNKAQEAIDLRNERVAVAERLGKTTEEGYKMALEAEKEDDNRRRGSLGLNPTPET